MELTRFGKGYLISQSIQRRHASRAVFFASSADKMFDKRGAME